MKRCEHPKHQVTADILEGDCDGYQVHWCRHCGAYAVRHHNSSGLVDNTSAWTVPTVQIDPLCPTPELEGTYPVVLYFENRAEAEEFEQAVLKEKPNLKPAQL